MFMPCARVHGMCRVGVRARLLALAIATVGVSLTVVVIELECLVEVGNGLVELTAFVMADPAVVKDLRRQLPEGRKGEGLTSAPLTSRFVSTRFQRAAPAYRGRSHRPLPQHSRHTSQLRYPSPTTSVRSTLPSCHFAVARCMRDLSSSA